MNKVKNIDIQVRQAYEPISVKVMKITPQGVLCSSSPEDSVMGMQSFVRMRLTR